MAAAENGMPDCATAPAAARHQRGMGGLLTLAVGVDLFGRLADEALGVGEFLPLACRQRAMKRSAVIGS